MRKISAKHINCKHCNGRSLTEMIGILALIAVLSIGLLAGLRYAMAKMKANQILEDVSLAYADATTTESRQFDVLYDLSFTPTSGFTMQSERISHTNSFGFIDIIVVKNIPKRICGIIKEMNGTNGLSLFGIDEQSNEYFDFNNCVEDNAIAFTWGDVSGGKYTCDKGCPEKMHCNINNECVCDVIELDECHIQNMTTCEAVLKNSCECMEEKTEECCAELDGSWNGESCCLQTVCVFGYTNPVGSTGQKSDCSYKYTNPEGSVTKQSDCSYKYTNPEGAVTKKSDCYYEYVNPEGVTETLADGTIEHKVKLSWENFKNGGGCDPGQYCKIAWSDEGCSSGLGATGAEIVRGVCTPTNSNSWECPTSHSVELTLTTFEELDGCDPDQYCKIAWSDEGCSSGLGATGAEIVRGVCTATNSNSWECPTSHSVELSWNMFTLLDGCDPGQYCKIAWSDEGCSSGLGATGAEIVRGVCTATNSNSWLCPTAHTVELSWDYFSIPSSQSTCAYGMYCKLSHSDAQMSSGLGATGSDPMYGLCLPVGQTSKSCEM